MNQFAATVLDNASMSVAGYAASELIALRPHIAEHFQPGAHRAWQEFYHARIGELSSALLVNDPKLFASDVAWSKSLFSVRGVNIEDLQFAFHILRSTIENELPEKVRNCLPAFLDAAEAELRSDSVKLPDGIRVDSPRGRLAALFLQAILEGERWRACKLVLDAVDDDVTVEEAYEGILMPVAREVGRMWHAGELNVAEEHFATATTEMVMSQLFTKISRLPRNGKTAIVSAAQGNHHGLPVRVISDFFEMAGWRVINLGCDMPERDLAQATEDYEADLVALSVTMSRHLRNTKACIEKIRSTKRGDQIKVLIGGLAISSSSHSWKELGADGYAESGPDAVRVAADLVGLPPRANEASSS